MELPELEKLPREVLVELVRAYARNWQTLDGLWFGAVESEYGLAPAAMLDLRNWEKMAALEAARIKKALKLEEGGLASVLKVLSLMCWQLASPLFEVEEESDSRIVFCYATCPVQESRRRSGKPVFACKTMKLTLLSGVSGVVEPNATVKCLTAPPDPHGGGAWCRWELRLLAQGVTTNKHELTRI
ncbi:MAG: hypothetical protein HY673_06430 [Chloroflexi bacterium]|nr:hypothetical protein [Chloroflexota bacterium]